MSEVETKKRFKMPHVYTIIFIMMVVCAILTWVIPSGQFERQVVDTGSGTREVTVAGTYHEVPKISEGEDLRQNIADVLQAPTLGIQAAVEVIAFIFIVGGSFMIITRTNAINAGMSHVIRMLKDKDILIIPITMLFFAFCGSTIGMSEETLPFYAIFLPIMMSMGYDSMTAFMIVYMGPKLGYIASTVNPFSVLIAQGIVGIEGNPQLWLRCIEFVVYCIVGIAWVVKYAKRVKADPESSITYQDDITKRAEFNVDDSALDTEFTGRHKAILLVFLAGMALIMWGLVEKGWYMNEISAVFFAMGIISGIIGGLTEAEMASEFCKGLSEFAYSAVVVGMARAILVVSNSGMIVDTILNALANGLAGIPPVLYTTLLFVVMGLLTFLVPSSSGLASLTMPIFGPLTELMGLNIEGAVTALALAEPTICMMLPVSGVLVAGLGVCRISLDQWWKVSWKFFLILCGMGIAFTAISGMLPA